MNVVGTLVSEHCFEIHHMAHARILVGDAHAAVDLAGFASDVQGHFDIVAFGHRDLCRGDLASVKEGTQAPSQQLGFGDLRDHLGEFLLSELEASDGLAKLLPL